MKQSAYLISLKEYCQPNGILSVIEENRTLPFAIRRCFFIYDLKPEDKRAVHAVNNQQCIFMLKGACDVMENKRAFITWKHPRRGFIFRRCFGAKFATVHRAVCWWFSPTNTMTRMRIFAILMRFCATGKKSRNKYV